MPHGSPAPDLPARARLLLRELCGLDVRRLNWLLAARGMAGLLLPLLIGRGLGVPDLTWMGVGAFLITIGDCVDDEDRQQVWRLLAGTVLGALALACGVVAGAALVPAVIGMAVWGALTALMTGYGPAFATMSLPVAWAYIQLGLPASDHSPDRAAWLALLFAAGGLLALGLAYIVRPRGPCATARSRLAACFRALAAYPDAQGDGPAITPEATLRGMIDDARRILAAQRPTAHPQLEQRLRRLADSADRLFSLASALKDSGVHTPATATQTLRAIAEALETGAGSRALRNLAAKDSDAFAQRPAPQSDLARLEMRFCRATQEAARIALGERDAEGPQPQPEPPPPPGLMAPLRQLKDPASPLARHALRFSVVTALAVVALWLFPRPFGFWVPLTVTVVLKPTASMTLLRAFQRFGGTVAGIAAGMVAVPFLPTVDAQLAYTSACFFFLQAALPTNYGIAIFFLSAGLIPYEHVLYPELHLDVGYLRLLATGVGAALALMGGHLLWPTFERQTLPARLGAAADAMAEYADAVLAQWDGGTATQTPPLARKKAGQAMSALQNGLQRALAEIGGKPLDLGRTTLAANALQQIFITLNGMMHHAPERAAGAPSPSSFRAAVVDALARAKEGGRIDSEALDLAVQDFRAAHPDSIGADFAAPRLCAQLRALGAAGDAGAS